MENNLPNGWAETTLDVIADWASGGTPKSTESKFYGGDIPWLIIGDLNDGEILSSQKTITKLGLENSSAKIAPVGAVLCAMYGSIGKLGITKTPCATNQAIAFTEKIHGGIPNKYLFYYLFSIKQYLLDIGKGGAQQNISQTVLKQVKIPIAPLAEQQRIVAKLDELMEKIDRSQTRLERIPKILKRFRQSILSAAVSGKLTEEWRKKTVDVESAEVLLKKIEKLRRTWIDFEVKNGNREIGRLLSKLAKHTFSLLQDEIPTNWSYSSLLNACQIVVDCHNKTAPYQRDGIYLIRTSNIKNGKIAFDDMRFVSQKTYEYWSRRCPPESGDIIFTREAPMGEAAIVPDATLVCLGQRTMLLRPPKGLMLNKYVLYSLMAPKMVDQINENAIGSGVKHLRVGDVESLVISIPPIAEQNEIVRRVEQLLLLADKIEARYIKAKAELNKLPLSLLAKAFRGELVQQGESDEPASVLLERIKCEKNALLVKNTKKKKYQIGPAEIINIAAEPKATETKYIKINIPESKKAFAKQVLGGKIVSLFKEDPHFTHIKFQKLQYLAEHLAEVDLNWNYYRQSAGPYDPKFMHTVAFKLKASKWFEEKKYKFHPLEKADKIEGYYEGYFKPVATKLDSLFSALKQSTEDEAEIVATLYAVWNNMIIKKEPINDDVIVSTFFEWSDRKKKYTTQQVSKSLTWMKKKGFVPTGFGRIIKEKKK